MPKFTFLHISDLHFSETNLAQNGVLKAFLVDLEKVKTEQSLKPDFVVFSGDLVNAGSNYKEFTSVKKEFIDKLLHSLNLTQNEFFICPGNHDIDRTAIRKFTEDGLNNTIASTKDIDKIIEEYDTYYKDAFTPRFKNYKKFLEETKIGSTSLAKSNIFSTFKFSVRNTKIGIACLNSSLRATGEGETHDYGKLILGSKQINSALTDLEDCDVKIANLHHPVDWITDTERYDISKLLKRKFDFILYGHNHSFSSDQIINAEYDTIALNSPALYENTRTFVGYSIAQVFPTQTHIHLRTYFSERDIFDKGINHIPNGVVTITTPKKSNPKIEDVFVPRKYPLEDVKQLFSNYNSLNESKLFSELEKLKGKSFVEIGYKASAIVSLLISQNSQSLSKRDLSNLCLKGTDFTGADLTETKFSQTDISNAFFSDVILDNASFDEVDLSESQFIEIENKRAVDFTDENQVVSGGSSGAIIYWNSKIILRGHRSSILDLRFSCCKKYLASAHDNGQIFIWQPNQSIEPLKVLSRQKNPIYTLCWHPTQSNILVSNGSNGYLNVWDWKNSEAPTKEIKNHKKEILTVDWSANGKYLLSSGIDRRILICDTRDWTPICILPIFHKDYVRAVKWKDENIFASCGDDGYVCIWSWINGSINRIFEHEFDISVLSLAWHPTLNILACGLRDDTVVFWDLENMSNIKFNEVRRIKLHTGRVWDINWDKQGKYLASAGNEGKVILWKNCFDSTTGKLLSEIEIVANTQVLKMNFSCNSLKLKNLKGLTASGYQTFSNKDREWDVQECSLQDWLLNHGAELD